jgi:hypothetical protein
VFGEYDAGPPEQYIFRVRFFQDTPQEWGLLVGDFAHNARSALDHLAWQVVLFGGGNPDDRTGFPITLRRGDWLGQVAKLDGAQPDHVALIEKEQPFHRRDLYGKENISGSMEHPLAVLNFLNNVDKHRVLNTTPAAVRGFGWDVEVISDIKSADTTRSTVSFEPLEDGAPLVRVPIVSSGPNPRLKLKRQLEQLELVFQQRTKDGTTQIVRHAYLFENFEAILDEVQGLIDLFVTEFR